jgi:hypothetical protein
MPIEPNKGLLKRVVAFVSLTDYKKLRAKLILKDLTFTQWLRNKISEEINDSSSI